MKKTLSSRCPHVATIGLISDEDYRRSIQKLGCDQCGSINVQLWLCLRSQCLFVGCTSGKDGIDHSSEHEKEKAHPLQLNLTTKRIWCYSCSQEVFIDNDPPFRISISEKNSVEIIDESVEISLETRNSSIVYPIESLHRSNRKSFEPKFFEIEHSTLTKDKNHCLSGLINLGNTCYMNSALQALSHCVPLTSYFLDYSRLIMTDGYFNRSSKSKSNGKLSRSFVKYLETSWIKSSNSRTNHPLNPNSIAIEIRSINPSFRCYTQQDAQEFLRCFMDELHEEMTVDQSFENNNKRDRNDSISDESEIDSTSSIERTEYESCLSDLNEELNDDLQCCSSNENNFEMTKSRRIDSIVSFQFNLEKKETNQTENIFKQIQSNKSIISSIFDGFIESQIQCLTCDRRSTTIETFQDLSLPIPSREQIEKFHSIQIPSDGSTSISSDSWISWFYSIFKNLLTLQYWSTSLTLEDCLQAFFQADQLTGDNMYSCDKCLKLRNGVKYSRVIQLPEVLCIHLKRFRHDSIISSKINNYVSFPLVDLDLTQFLHQDCPSQVKQYDLFSLIVHYGRAGSGHYISYCLNHIDNQWYEYDDENVRQVDSTIVQNAEAYILFYRKKEGNFIETYENLRHLFSTDQDNLLPFYVSRSWINRLFYFAEPGPVSNKDVLCKHGGVYPSKWNIVNDLMTPIPQTVWNFLCEKYGGCSSCNILYPCLKCQLEDEKLKCRQRREKKMFSQLSRTNKENEGVYALNPSWYKIWINFVLEKSSEIPGPISNSAISTTKNGLAKLIRRDCNHLQINQSVWNYLHSIYGGGPEILIRQRSSSSHSFLDEQQI